MTLSTSRLRLLNQRFEYDHYRRLLSDPKFRGQFDVKETREFECGKFLWTGVQEGATVFLQRIVLGLEARIPTAVFLELSCREKLTLELAAKLEDPFRLGGSGTADCYYNRAPALIDQSFALQTAKPDLWRLVKSFYKDIRNPIFHGSYLVNLDAAKLDEIFSVFDEVYLWCDSWCDVITRLNEVGSGKHGRPQTKQA